jgi:hypothetical protein
LFCPGHHRRLKFGLVLEVEVKINVNKNCALIRKTAKNKYVTFST